MMKSHLESFVGYLVAGLATLLVTVGAAPQAWGLITPIAWYQLGESDPGAAAGNPGNATTIDSVGGNNLTKIGSPAYSSNVSLLAKGSTLSMAFAPGGEGYASTTPATTATTDVGMEAWVDPSGSVGLRELIVNNGSASDGYGFYLSEDGKNYVLQMPNIGLFVIGPATVGQWDHLGFVRDASGNDFVYLDGVLTNTSNMAPVTPGGIGDASGNNFVIAGDSASAPFYGNVDQVRLFTFSGTFDPSDFLITTPEPSSISLLGVSGLLLSRRRRRRILS